MTPPSLPQLEPIAFSDADHGPGTEIWELQIEAVSPRDFALSPLQEVQTQPAPTSHLYKAVGVDHINMREP